MKLLFLSVIFLVVSLSHAAEKSKPVLLFSRYYNGVGDDRYTTNGAYKDLTLLLSNHFEVRSNRDPLDEKNLADVKVVLFSNLSDKAVGNNPPPQHVTAKDAAFLASFVKKGGGIIFFGNQSEGHNLEVKDSNQLLAQFGIQATNLITDAKKLVLPANAPIIGGLRWAYYTGNLLILDPRHPAHPHAIVQNDLQQKPVKGTNDQAGVLLAGAELGKGRVIVATDAGWPANWAFSEEGVGGVSIKGQDNKEILTRLARWVSGR